MNELTVLRDLVVVFAVAVVVVPLLQRIRVPSIAGFIFAGVLVGPGALGLVGQAHEVEVLAELGVVLLLFGIGLELSLERLRRLWRPIVVGGTLQVALTAGAAALIAGQAGLATRSAIFVGLMAAVSSTAIVLRGLQARGEVDAPHGRLTLGVLVFQDLCVVPMILAIPLLASGPGDGTRGVALASLKAVGVLVGVLVGARLLVPRALALIARTRQRDLFILAVFLVCVGTAWIVSLAGISLALGAFLAGLVVAGSAYRHQALADLIPFREVLTSLFFISVGMLLDPRALWADAGPTLLVVGGVIAGKLALVVVVGVVMRLPLRVSILAGVALAQMGEFSFVLVRAADGTGLLLPSVEKTLTAAAILTMLLTPLALRLGPHVAAGAGRVLWLTRLLGVQSVAEAARGGGRWEGHVVIAGYGVAGQELTRALRGCGGVPYVVVELNPANVQAAADAGDPAVFGDVTSPEVLEHLKIERASELVIVINDPDAVTRAVAAARRAAPDLHIIVRARYLADVPLLEEAGASLVVPEEVEAAREVAERLVARRCEVRPPATSS
jgi:CPA2 family monovalent cation:H+ antiporter-2